MAKIGSSGSKSIDLEKWKNTASSERARVASEIADREAKRNASDPHTYARVRSSLLGNNTCPSDYGRVTEKLTRRERLFEFLNSDRFKPSKRRRKDE